MNIRVGHGRRCITPPLGIGMVGYASRKEGTTGVHDDIFAHAVALDDGQAPVALVALDICLLTPGLAAEFKQAIAGGAGLPPERIFLNTSHTHAGPTLGGRGDDTEQVLAYRATAIAQTVAAVRDAFADAAPAVFRVGRAPLDIGCNRRETRADGRVILGHDSHRPTCKRLAVWHFARTGQPDVVLFSAPMHGTTLGGQNLLVSGEWMGMAIRYCEEACPDLRAVFLQGCGADQEPYYSRVPGGRGTFAELEAHGRAAAAAVAEALAAASPLAPLPMRAALREVDLAPKLPGEEARTLVLHGLRFGEALLLSLSAETFVEYALYGAAVSPAAETLVLGYTDGSIGYLCTANAYPEGGYETDTTRVAPGAEGVVKAAMNEIIADLTA